MHSQRTRRGQGEDMGGSTITSRTSGIDPRHLSKLEGGLVAAQVKEDLKPPPSAAFRDRPEIAAMRERARVFRESYRPNGETPEQLAKRLRARR